MCWAVRTLEIWVFGDWVGKRSEITLGREFWLVRNRGIYEIGGILLNTWRDIYKFSLTKCSIINCKLFNLIATIPPKYIYKEKYFKKQQVLQLNNLLSSTGSFISIKIHWLLYKEKYFVLDLVTNFSYKYSQPNIMERALLTVVTR